LEPGQNQVSAKLLGMNRMVLFHRFKLHDDRIFHQQVSSKPLIKFHTFVFHGNRDLASYLQAASLQFESQCHLVHRFQQTWPKLRMNSVGGINDLRGDFVWLHGSRGVAESAEENKSNCDNPIATGSTEKETSGYGALANLLNAIGHTLKPKVRCFIHVKNSGAGLPDGGLFTPDQLKNTDDEAPLLGIPLPSRGVIEVKATSAEVDDVADTLTSP
jgi:hypothetical protein